MVTMVHPNGCVHNVADELVPEFKAWGWVEKAVHIEPPTSATKQEKPKTRRKTARK